MENARIRRERISTRGRTAGEGKKLLEGTIRKKGFSGKREGRKRKERQ